MRIRHALTGLAAAALLAAGMATAPAAVAASPTAPASAAVHKEAAPDAKALVPVTGSTVAGTTLSAAAVTCPAPGHRFKLSNEATVYLAGPSDDLYYFPNSTEYFSLYSSYSGIATISATTWNACLSHWNEGPFPLNSTELVKQSGDPAVYIWDSSYQKYRWITSQSVFDKYGFDSSKIRTVFFTISPGPAWWE